MAAERKKPWYEEPDVSLRVRQLVALRDLGVYGLNGGSASARERQFSEIDAAAGQLPINRAEDSVFMRIKNLIEAAIRELEDEALQAATGKVFGMTLKTITMNVRERREAGSKELGWYTVQTWQKNVKGERLFFQFVDVAIDKAVDAARRVPDRTTDDYVERPELRIQFAEALEVNKKLILLYGEGGTGKTRAAIGLTRDLDCVVIRANQSELLHDDMAQALEDRGLSASGDDGSVRRSFRRLLQGDKAPKYVVIDDVQDERELELYCPLEARSVVIITSRLKMLRELSHIAFIKVDSLSEEQGLCLLDRFLPDAPLADKRRLCDVLAGRALAIKQAGAYLAEYTAVTSAEFVSVLQGDHVYMLNEIPDVTDVKLPQMYEQILAKILTSNPIAAHILKAITFTDRTVIRRLLRRFAAPAVQVSSSSGAIEATMISRAFNLLENLCLVELEENSRITFVSIHPLTQAIFRHFLMEEADHVCEQLQELARAEIVKVKDELRQAWRNERPGTPTFESEQASLIANGLENQYWETARVRALWNPTDESREKFIEAVGDMYQTIGNATAWKRAYMSPVQEVDFIREVTLTLPRGLQPFFRLKLMRDDYWYEKAKAWFAARGKYPFGAD